MLVFLGIVDDTPEFFDEPFGIRQFNRVQRLVGSFFHAQQDDAAERIGECGIRLPDAFGQPARGFFRLDAVVFSVLFKTAEVNHIEFFCFLVSSQLFSSGS